MIKENNIIKEGLLIGGVGLVGLANLFTKEEYKLIVVIVSLCLILLRSYLKQSIKKKKNNKNEN